MSMKLFKTADAAAARDGLILAVDGFEKTGKTHFGLTGPETVAVLNIDFSLGGVLAGFPGKSIVVHDICLPVRKATPYDSGKEKYRRALEEADTLFDQFVNAYYEALSTDAVSTIVWDSATEIWELHRLARFGKLAQVMPQYYAEVNDEHAQLVRKVRKTGKHLVLLHKYKKEYKGNDWTGGWERSGFKGTAYEADINLALRFDADDRVFTMRVESSRHNASLLTGAEFEDEDVSMATLFEFAGVEV